MALLATERPNDYDLNTADHVRLHDPVRVVVDPLPGTAKRLGDTGT